MKHRRIRIAPGVREAVIAAMTHPIDTRCIRPGCHHDYAGHDDPKSLPWEACMFPGCDCQDYIAPR